MLLMMAVSLYTSRITLSVLGISDFGIYNVVGGVVALFVFLNSSLSNAVQRFLSYALGKADKDYVNRIFNVSLCAHFIIAIVIALLCETVGLWFIYNKMNFPINRFSAVLWVFHCSMFCIVLSIMQAPYTAIILSKEKMSIYAYISIAEAVLKLLIVYVLVVCAFDKLKFYAVLILIVSVIVSAIYCYYASRKFEEVKFKFIWDSSLLKKIVSFAGWNMFGELAWTFTNQGGSILLNMFFGPVVNAAQAISVQVNNAVNRFVSNFQVAVNPQIIKLYASEEVEKMNNLVIRSTKYSFFLIYALSLPLIMEVHFVLNIWLDKVPAHTDSFCVIILINSCLSAMTNVLSIAARAYGNIKKYQIIISGVLFLNFPLTYILLKFGAFPEIVAIINTFITVVLLFVRFYLVRDMVGLSFKSYFGNAIYPIFRVALFPLLFIVPIVYLFEDSLFRFIGVSFFSFALLVFSVYFGGLNKEERVLCRDFFVNFKSRFSFK